MAPVYLPVYLASCPAVTDSGGTSAQPASSRTDASSKNNRTVCKAVMEASRGTSFVSRSADATADFKWPEVLATLALEVLAAEGARFSPADAGYPTSSIMSSSLSPPRSESMSESS